MILSETRHDIITARRGTRLAVVAAFAIGVTTLSSASAQPAARQQTEATPLSNTTEISSRRKVRRTVHERRRIRRVRHGRRAGRPAQHRGGREASIAPELRALIGDLRQKHGADSVRVISGRDSRGYAKSCHPLGQAFDAHVSKSAMADLRSRHFGLITYSGGMHHVHVSSCAREAGLRAHKSVGGRNIFARYMGGTKRGK